MFCSASIFAAVALLLGRDLNWDYFNYHSYAALSALGDRLEKDFFAAGYQGYLNPLPFLPFALMDQAGWASAAMATGLAVLQSLNAFFLYLLARELTLESKYPVFYAAIITVLGCASPVLASQIGSSFVDPLTTPPVMAALWLLARSQSSGTGLIAGVLAGSAFALKLTNAPFVVGILLAICCYRGSRQFKSWASDLTRGCVGVAFGFIALYGFWGARLMQSHGSPIFPLFNNLFKSPDFPEQGTAFHRFIPQNLWQAINLPFEMIENRSWIYTEVSAPDLRPASLMALCAAVALLGLWKGAATTQSGYSQNHVRASRVVWAFLLPACLAWLVTSANGRYAVPILLMLGPALWLSAYKLAGADRAGVVCAGLAILQLVHMSSAGNPRWNPKSWTDRWLPISVPSGLKSEPLLFVTIGRSSESYLAAHVHRESVFTNPIGLVSIANDGPSWHRFEALRGQWAGRTRLVFNVNEQEARDGAEKSIASSNEMIDRLGLEIRSATCDLIIVNSSDSKVPPPPEIPGLIANNRYALACPVQLKPKVDPELAQQRKAAETVMDAFETKCPALFLPKGVQVERTGASWTRSYGKYDLFLRIIPNPGIIEHQMERQGEPVRLGTLADWRSALGRFDCALPHLGSRGMDATGFSHATR